MDEFYTYRKGIGWILGPTCEFEVRLIQGHYIRIEHRKPEIGEKLYYLTKSSYVDNDGKFNFDKLFEHFEHYVQSPNFNTATYDGSKGARQTYQLDSDMYTHVVIQITRIT